LESNSAGYLDFLHLDWISFSFQPDLDYANEIKSGRAKNLGITIFRNHMLKIYLSDFSP